MTIGASIFLIAVGAILKFAVTESVAGIDIQVVGVILMVAGGLGLLLGLFLMAQARRVVPVEQQAVVQQPVVQQPVYNDPNQPPPPPPAVY